MLPFFFLFSPLVSQGVYMLLLHPMNVQTFEMSSPPSGSLASTDATSSYRNRMHMTLGTCGLVQLSFPQFISSLLYSYLCNPFRLLACISLFLFFHSVHIFFIFFFFVPFYSPSFSTSPICVIFMFSQVLVFLCLFSHIFVQALPFPFVLQFRKLQKCSSPAHG